MIYKLNYGELPTGSDVQDYYFGSFSELTEFVQAVTKDKHCAVFLYQYGKHEDISAEIDTLENPIIITPNRDKLLTHVFNNRLHEFHVLFEYESYEDAFATAKDLLEHHPLCYGTNIRSIDATATMTAPQTLKGTKKKL